MPFAIREAEKDLQLGQYAVPAGTQMAVCVYSMQRHAAHWAEPASHFLINSSEQLGVLIRTRIGYIAWTQLCQNNISTAFTIALQVSFFDFH